MLCPGEKATLRCTYETRITGEHTLPFIFRIQNGLSNWQGRSRMIVLHGKTTAAGQPVSPVICDDFHLMTIPTGLQYPPIHVDMTNMHNF